MAGVGSLGRMNCIVNRLGTVLSRSSVSHSQVRKFYLRSTCAATNKVEMPSLSPTMEAGTIVKWHKKEGDPVQPGDLLCDIQTDKAIVGMEYDEEGVVAKILKPDNSENVTVGTLIALVVDEGDDWQSVEVPAGAGAAAPQAAGGETAAPSPVATAAPTGGSTPGMKVEMPSLSPSMEEGTIVAWHKKEGDTVKQGELLCDIQTDKAIVGMEWEDDEAILAKILNQAGSTKIKVGTLIAMMVAEGEDWKDVQIPAQTAAPSSEPVATSTSPPPAAEKVAAIEVDLPGIGPSVKKLLQEYNITPSSVSATGPKGNLIKGDILNYIQSKGLHKVDQTGKSATPEKAAAPTLASPPAASSPSRGEPYIDIPLSSMRKVIAKRLTESKSTVPHAYSTIDCSMQIVTNARARFIEQGIRVSMNDFIIKAAGFALERSPRVNATYKADNFQPSPTVDISVAVATEGGLITPIVQNVPSLGVAQISETVKALAEKARAGKLQPHEFQGGSFSISNLGMFGIKEFSAVINPPQVAILAIGGTRLTVGNENSIIDPKMSVTLSYDSRVMDEKDALQFLELFRLGLQNPDILVGGTVSVRNADFAVGSAV
ncbi:pyruvate dehydrogenase protein X component-like [Littorina saxatilis]|uniref:Dihydrolipoamide acetyltransferase component of pyruvate dehydrogenase complex n=1 Tax=Littorina saxatilis TaxID=31220 RepID=A0AAN9G880_9CAEN